MSRQRIVPVYAINIAADPHPRGVYVRLLWRAARIIVKARGSDYARLTRPVRSRINRHIYVGKLLLWTDIDLAGDWIDLQRQDKLSEDDRKKIQIPENARPNFRVFEYVFNINNHVMLVEGRNELDNTIGPSVVDSILQRIFGNEFFGQRYPETAVTMIPDEGVAEELLAIPFKQIVIIKAHRPNPDFASPGAVQRVNQRMDRLRVHTIEQRLSKNATSDSIVLDGEDKDLAEVAVDNGVLRIRGKDNDEKRVDLSSQDRPRKINLEMDRDESFLATLLEKLPGMLRN